MSTASLHRLVYISRNAIGPRLENVGREIEQILTASTRNNAPLGVTGALLFNAGCFAQVLEGPGQAVEDTFERIQVDERHHRVELLSFVPVVARGFPRWSMAYVGSETEAARRFAALAASGFDSTLLGDDEVYELLRAHLVEAELRLG